MEEAQVHRVVEAKGAGVKVGPESAAASSDLALEVRDSSLPSFLSRTGLLSITDGLRRAGLSSVEDILQLTPRKYAAVGVGDGDTALGTRLRLERAIRSEIKARELAEMQAREFQRIRAFQTAHVLVGTELVEFRMSPSANIAELGRAVSLHTGLPEDSFRLVHDKVAAHDDHGRHSTVAFSQNLLLSAVFASNDIGNLVLRPVGGKWPTVHARKALQNEQKRERTPISGPIAFKQLAETPIQEEQNCANEAIHLDGSIYNVQATVGPTSEKRGLRKNSRFSLTREDEIEEEEEESTILEKETDATKAKEGNMVEKGKLDTEEFRKDTEALSSDSRMQTLTRPLTKGGSEKYGSIKMMHRGDDRDTFVNFLPGNCEMVARFVPNILVRHYLELLKKAATAAVPKPCFERITAALIFLDISGFTPLSAKLGQQGAVGIELLSKIL